MTTFKRVCIEDYTVTDGVNTLTVERAKEYTTSRERDGHVMVFSRFWVRVPVSIFAGERPYTP